MDLTGWKRVVLANKGALIGLLVSALTASGWWLATGGERRVDAACSAWLEHRLDLRDVVSEYDEAAGRAKGSGADVRDELNNPDSVTAVLAKWTAASRGVRRSLEGSIEDSGDTTEESLHFFLGLVDEQLGLLDKAVATGDSIAVAAELDEASARFQAVDDICLAAART